MQHAFRSIFTTGLFIAICAVVLCLETTLITALPRESVGFYAFVFFATWSSYRVHSLAARPSRRRAIGTGLLVLVTLATAFALRPIQLPWVGLAALLSLCYSVPALPGGRRLREYGIAKILILTGVWTLVTGYLPLVGKLDTSVILLLLPRRFLFVFALCLAFDVRDHLNDAREGIYTLPVRIGVDRSFVIIRLTLVAYAALLLLTPISGVHRPTSLITGALLLSGLATGVAIEGSRYRETSKLYHLAWIDGMMAVQAALVAIACWLAA